MAMYNELFTSSRRRTDMTQIFDVFMEIDADSGFQYVYPAGCEDVQAKQFVFPTGSAEDMPARISRFTFIKTDSKARLTYGYCRYTPSRKTVLCFETGFAVDHFFFPALNEIAGIGHDRQLMETYLSRIYAAELPKPGETVTITNRLTFRTPFLVPRVPSPKSRNVQKLAACLPRKILLALYGSLLRERRILLTSTMLSRLSACVQAVAELTFPIHWQHALIPILPTKMITMTCSPSPYIIGLPKQVADVTTLQEVGDVVIVDLDKPEFTSSELDRLPEAAGQFLRKTLQENDAEYPIRFLEATAMIFGQYWKGFANDEPTGQDMWDSDQFHQITGNDYYQSQCLLQFCDERAGFLHRGLRLDDDFERIARSSNTVDFRLELVQLLKKKTETVVEKCSSRLKKTFDQMKRRKTISEPSSIIPPEWPVEKFCDLIDLTSPPVSPFPTTARRQTLPAILDPNTPYYTPTV